MLLQSYAWSCHSRWASVHVGFYFCLRSHKQISTKLRNLGAQRPRGYDDLRNDHRHDDDHQQDDDSDDYAHAHLHVLPPHLLSDSVGAATEALGRNRQIVCNAALAEIRVRIGNMNAPVLSWRLSSLAPRSATLLMFSRIMPTVSSICYIARSQMSATTLPKPSICKRKSV
jgi:hypothetical protein